MTKDQQLLLAVSAIGIYIGYQFYKRNTENKAAENFSGVRGAMVNPCAAKLNLPCGENQGGDWVTGTWQSAGYGRGCVCKRGGASIASPNLGGMVGVPARRGRTVMPTRGFGRGHMGGAGSHTVAAKKWCKSIHTGDLAPCGRWDATTVEA